MTRSIKEKLKIFCFLLSYYSSSVMLLQVLFAQFHAFELARGELELSNHLNLKHSTADDGCQDGKA